MGSHPKASPARRPTSRSAISWENRFTLPPSRGRVVVLTFIYTHCENECPFVTLKLKRARALLGSDAGEAVFVAVTTDPRRDTRTVIERYSREAGMLDGWYFLTGSLDEVKSVWTSYGVGVRDPGRGSLGWRQRCASRGRVNRPGTHLGGPGHGRKNSCRSSAADTTFRTRSPS